MCVAVIGALGHVTTTIILSLMISTMGNTLISEDLYNKACLIILLSLAGYYLFTYTYHGRRDSAACCTNTTTTSSSCDDDTTTLTLSSTIDHTKQADGDDDAVDINTEKTSSKFAALSVISLTTFSPCLGSMPMTLSLLNPPVEYMTVFKLWMTLGLVAICVMTTLVFASFVGVKYAILSKVKRHERLLLGITLIVLALVTYSMNHDSHHHHHHHGVAHDMMTGGKEENGKTSCSHGHHHGHEMEENEGEVMRKADVVNADMNVVINGRRQKFGSAKKDDDNR